MLFGDIGIPDETGTKDDVPLPKIKVTSKGTGMIIAITVIWLGTLVFSLFFASIPQELLGAIGIEGVSIFQLSIVGAITWLTIFAVWNVVVPAGQEFLVIERLGKYYAIKHSGIGFLCLRGVIDKVRDKGTLKALELPMYADEVAEFAIDFKDGSAPIDASIWHRIGAENAAWGEIDRAIIAHTYAYENPGGRVEEIVDGHARPILQKHSIDEAQEKKDSIAGEVSKHPEVLDAMKKTGHFFVEGKGLIISDIALTQEIKDLRRQVLEGKKDAERDVAKGEGYARAIKGIIEELKVDKKTARGIYETQRGLETVEKTGSNINFVAPTVDGVLITLGMNKSGGES